MLVARHRGGREVDARSDLRAREPPRLDESPRGVSPDPASVIGIDYAHHPPQVCAINRYAIAPDRRHRTARRHGPSRTRTPRPRVCAGCWLARAVALLATCMAPTSRSRSRSAAMRPVSITHEPTNTSSPAPTRPRQIASGKKSGADRTALGPGSRCAPRAARRCPPCADARSTARAAWSRLPARRPTKSRRRARRTRAPSAPRDRGPACKPRTGRLRRSAARTSVVVGAREGDGEAEPPDSSDHRLVRRAARGRCVRARTVPQAARIASARPSRGTPRRAESLAPGPQRATRTRSRRTSVTRPVDRHAPPRAASRSSQARSHRRHSSADRRQCSWWCA